MSLCIRPVIEQWGESMTYSSRDTRIEERLRQLADAAGIEYGCGIYEYGDVNVFWVAEGERFLNFLIEHRSDNESLVAKINSHNGDSLSQNRQERAVEVSDIRNICQMAEAWRKSVDPADGSLRIYCD